MQALLPLVEQMCKGVANGKYGIAVFGDLDGAFDAVRRKCTLYKLHKAGITNNLLSVFSSFPTDRFYSNLANSYTATGIRKKMQQQFYFDFCRCKSQIRQH